MKTIYTPAEAAAYFARETGDPDISERDVFECIKKKHIQEGFLSVVIQPGTALECRSGFDTDKWTTYTLRAPMELFVGGSFLDDFVQQISLTGYGLPGQLSNAMLPPHNLRYDTSTPIPAADVRLRKQLVLDLLPAWNRLLIDIESGAIKLDGLMECPSMPAKQATTTETVADGIPEPQRRIALLRTLGGTAKYKNSEWAFTGITRLVAKEKADGRKRCTEKTVRVDLKEAAQAERAANRAGFGDGLGQR